MKIKLITNKDPEEFQSNLQKELDDGWLISGGLSTSTIATSYGIFVVYSILLIKN
jgi:hypothetical protein